MTYQEIESKLQEKVKLYNQGCQQDAKKSDLDSLEEKMAEIAKDGKKTMLTEKYNSLIANFENPMLEAARTFEIDVPSYRIITEKKRTTGAEVVTKKVTLSAKDLTEKLGALSAKDGYVSSGVIKNGECWSIRCEKLAFHFILALAKELNLGKEAMAKIEADYRMKDVARQIDLGKDPTSTTQLVNNLQAIIDLMVFVPNEKFPEKNAIKVTSADATYIKRLYAKATREAGIMQVLKGKNMAQYVFEVAHMIISGKGYGIQSKDVKDSSNHAYVVRGEGRQPIPESAPRAKEQNAAA